MPIEYDANLDSYTVLDTNTYTKYIIPKDRVVVFNMVIEDNGSSRSDPEQKPLRWELTIYGGRTKIFVLDYSHLLENDPYQLPLCPMCSFLTGTHVHAEEDYSARPLYDPSPQTVRYVMMKWKPYMSFETFGRFMRALDAKIPGVIEVLDVKGDLDEKC